MPVSVAPKLAPVTVIEVPGAPLLGLMVILGVWAKTIATPPTTGPRTSAMNNTVAASLLIPLLGLSRPRSPALAGVVSIRISQLGHHRPSGGPRMGWL